MSNLIFFSIRCICCLLQIIPGLLSCAQKNINIIDSVAEHMNNYAAANPSSRLFVHFDKNVYSNFENVWFRAYLLNSNVPLESINTLSVFLLKNNDRSIWAESHFVMQNGLASGNMFLPDSLPPGNFSLIAYTNHIVNGYPDHIFIQPVTIKTIESEIKVSLNLLDSAGSKEDSDKVLLKVYNKDYKSLKNASFNYTIGSNSSPHRALTNKLGEYMFKVPANLITPGNNVLHVEIKDGVLFKGVAIALPVYRKPPNVNFYPEGGNLVDATPVAIGWEAKNDKEEPLQVNGFLYENGNLIDTVGTNADGRGQFAITPKKDNRYTVKLMYEISKDTEYALPAVVPVMPALTVLNAIANDSLNIVLRNINSVDEDIYLILHDYKTLFAAYRIKKDQPNQSLKIPLTRLPKGIFAITLLDNSKRPFAERLCFAHYGNRHSIVITSDSTTYTTRQKINVKIRLTDKDGKPVDGIVSVACVQANRIEAAKVKFIESYSYLGNLLDNLAFTHNPFTSAANTNQFLENILLIKGWRRYTWTDMIHSKPGDTKPSQDKVTFNGSVTRNGKALNKPVELAISANESVKLIKSDAVGKFELSVKDLICPPDKKVLLFVNKGSQTAFDIRVEDPYHEINEKLAKELRFDNYDINQTSESLDKFVLGQGEYYRVLQTVTVKANNAGGKFYGHYPIYHGKCSDYVCLYGFLNCIDHPNSPGNTKPKNGGVYISMDPAKPGWIQYKSDCEGDDSKNKAILMIDGIYTKKEFYISDISKSANNSPEYLSTIYWNASLLLTEGNQSPITFYTGDIAGRFRIIVQGRTNDDVVFGEYYFNVISK